MELIYFFDSYALIEVIKGKPSYIKYTDCNIAMTIFNLVEVINSVYLDYGETKALEIYEQLIPCVQEVDYKVVLEAVKLKQKYKKRDLSYADCIGYAYAKAHHLLFLTGDMDFEDIDNVEYVK